MAIRIRPRLKDRFRAPAAAPPKKTPARGAILPYFHIIIYCTAFPHRSMPEEKKY